MRQEFDFFLLKMKLSCLGAPTCSNCLPRNNDLNGRKQQNNSRDFGELRERLWTLLDTKEDLCSKMLDAEVQRRREDMIVCFAGMTGAYL